MNEQNQAVETGKGNTVAKLKFYAPANQTQGIQNFYELLKAHDKEFEIFNCGAFKAQQKLLTQTTSILLNLQTLPPNPTEEQLAVIQNPIADKILQRVQKIHQVLCDEITPYEIARKLVDNDEPALNYYKNTCEKYAREIDQLMAKNDELLQAQLEQLEQAKEQAETKLAKGLKRDTIYLPNNKVQNNLAFLEHGRNVFDISRNNQDACEIIVTLDYDKKKISNITPLKDPFKLEILDAWHTIKDAGNDAFTLNELFKLNHPNLGRNIKSGERKKLMHTLLELTGLWIDIDYTAEYARSHKTMAGDEHHLKGQIISFVIKDGTEYGYPYELLFFNGVQPLYEYAKIANQIIRIEREKLDSALTGMNYTTQTRRGAKTLLKRINRIEEKNWNEVYSLNTYTRDTLLKPYDTLTTKQQEGVRSNLKRMLENQKRDKFIKSYKFVKNDKKDRRKITAVEIKPK